MQINRNSLETERGRSDWFTGEVFIDTIAAPTPHSHLSAALVHFTPSARTAWHSHPFAQTLYVTQGVGLCQRRGGAVEVIKPGDRVHIEPGEEHWHGAAPGRFMTHLVIQVTDGADNPVILGDHVGDDEYDAAGMSREGGDG